MSKIVKTVCVDLDGVLAQYDGWKGIEYIGDPIPGAKQFVEALCMIPAKVCIWTTRANSEANRESVESLRSRIELWLDHAAIPYDSIHVGPGKPLAAAFIDDRAVVCRPQKDIENQDYDTALRMAAALVRGTTLGSQGTFSHGKHGDEDEGDIKMMMSLDGGLVRIDFGKPVGWLALEKEHALHMANLLRKYARQAR